MTALRTNVLVVLGLLWSMSACDRSPAPELTAEPRPPGSSPAVAAPVTAAAPQIAAAPQAAIVEPALATGGSPRAIDSAGSLPTAASAAPAVRATKSPPDPNNPCADRYEERTDASGQVTRVLLQKDKRCSYKGEGGISPRGTVYGY